MNMQHSTVTNLRLTTIALFLFLIISSANVRPSNDTSFNTDFAHTNLTKLQGQQKLVYYCSGHFKTPPNYECDQSFHCTGWSGMVFPVSGGTIQAPGTNCLDTDCNTAFSVCDSWGSCTGSALFHPARTPWGRCTYNTVGTHSFQLFLPTPLI